MKSARIQYNVQDLRCTEWTSYLWYETPQSMLGVGILVSKLAQQTKDSVMCFAQWLEPCMQDQPGAVHKQEKGLLHAAWRSTSSIC